MLVRKLDTLTGHRDCIYVLESSGEKETFFSGAGDGMIAKWNLTDTDKGRLIAKLSNSVYALSYIQKHDILVIGHNYEGLHFINVEEVKEIGSVNFTKEAIFDIQYLGDCLYVGTGGGELIIYNFPQKKLVRKIQDANKSARSIAVNELLGEIAVGFSDNKIRIYELDGYKLKKVIDAHDNSVFTVRYDPDSNYLLSGSRDAHLKVWETKSYQLSESIVAHMYAINHIDYSPDGKHFVTCSMDKSIKVWDAATFKLLKVIDKSRHAGHATSVNKLLWSKHEDLLLSCSDDRTISVWDINFN